MTVQIRDELIYNNRTYYLNQELLEHYFIKFPDRKPKTDIVSTAVWKGYVATFKIVGRELLIDKIDWLISAKFDHEGYMNANFPGNKYSWFSGFIRIDDYRGDYMIDNETNEEAIYELLEIKKGNFVGNWKLNYTDFKVFKEILFGDFKETEEYQGICNRLRDNNPGITDEAVDKWISDLIIRNYHVS